ncbi:MAG: ABC transporter permease [Bryobacterales bacterium]|nr:ABC transporter permease [Bryobacterales bacterium]
MSPPLRRTLAIARKEFLHIVRDPLSLAMALAIPFAMLMLFGYALSLDVDRVPTVVFDGSRTPQSRELIAYLDGSRYFEVTEVVTDYKPVEQAIFSGQALLGVVIPADFARRVHRGDATDVQVILDGSDSNTANIAAGYAQGVLGKYSNQLQAQFANLRGAGPVHPPLDVQARVWFNADLKSKNFIIPGLIAVILQIIAALLTSLTIAREWELGNMELLLSTPMRPWELILGKMAAFFAIGVADTTFAVLVGRTVFGVPLRGSLWDLSIAIFFFLFGALCWGLLISALARNQLLAYQIGILTSFLPSFLLSGFIYAIENMPVPVQVVTHIVPARYFIAILKGVFLKGIGYDILWPQLLFLFLYALGVFLIASRRLNQKLVD